MVQPVSLANSLPAAQILDGRRVAAADQEQVAARAAALAVLGRTPRLATVLASDRPAAAVYAQQLQRLGHRLGVAVEVVPVTTGKDLPAVVASLSQRADVDGILVQQPLPPGVDREEVVAALDPAKDVDGTTWAVQGRLLGGRPTFVAATARAVVRLLDAYGVNPDGRHVVIVGASPVVGRPLSLLLLGRGATVTVCHDRTRDLAAHTRQADILVSAAGVPGLITASMVRPGAVVVDVGINRVGDRIVGDVDFEGVRAVAGAITPVPGGVGPVTSTLVLLHTVESAEARRRHGPEAAA